MYVRSIAKYQKDDILYHQNSDGIDKVQITDVQPNNKVVVEIRDSYEAQRVGKVFTIDGGQLTVAKPTIYAWNTSASYVPSGSNQQFHESTGCESKQDVEQRCTKYVLF